MTLSFILPPTHFPIDNDDEVDAEAQEEVEDMYGAKYLPPLVRQPLPIGPSVNAKAVFAYRNMQGSSVRLCDGDKCLIILYYTMNAFCLCLSVPVCGGNNDCWLLLVHLNSERD